jgi:transketolase
LLLSRQALPHQERNATVLQSVRRGGYVLHRESGPLELVLIGTGSEVALLQRAYERLQFDGICARVVSLPSPYVFDRQGPEYRADVLPVGVPRLAVEAGVTDYWRKYVGLSGSVVGIDEFGASGPAADLYSHFGITVDRIVSVAKTLLNARVVAMSTV